MDVDLDLKISTDEFIEFIKEGLSFTEGSKVLVAPEPPVDDLLFHATDMEGVLTIKVLSGKDLRKPSTWLTATPTPETTPDANKQLVVSNEVKPTATVPIQKSDYCIIKYDGDASKKYFFDKSRRCLPQLNPKKGNSSSNSSLNSSLNSKSLPTVPEDAALTADNLSKNNNTKSNALPSDNQHDLLDTKSFISEHGRYHHSENRIKTLEKIGNVAAVNLHTDSSFKSAEISRTRSLFDLKKRHLDAKADSKKNGQFT